MNSKLNKSEVNVAAPTVSPSFAVVFFTALAYACMSAFIPKYLYNFFLKDNSHVIQGEIYGITLTYLFKTTLTHSVILLDETYKNIFFLTI